LARRLVSAILFIERTDPFCQGIDEPVEFGIRQGTIDVAIELRDIARDIIRPEQDFRCMDTTRGRVHWTKVLLMLLYRGGAGMSRVGRVLVAFLPAPAA
jgi:hypothetical protein